MMTVPGGYRAAARNDDFVEYCGVPVVSDAVGPRQALSRRAGNDSDAGVEFWELANTPIPLLFWKASKYRRHVFS